MLHVTIKNTLPYCSKSLVREYGDIYFRAWRSASDVYLSKIEVPCPRASAPKSRVSTKARAGQAQCSVGTAAREKKILAHVRVTILRGLLVACVCARVFVLTSAASRT